MVLVNFNFETGDHECPYWTVTAVVKEGFDAATLEDSFASYLEQADEDLEFEDMVEDVLNGTQWPWQFVEDGIPACDSMHTMWL